MIAFDYRGFADSEDIRPTEESMVDDAFNVYDHVDAQCAKVLSTEILNCKIRKKDNSVNLLVSQTLENQRGTVQSLAFLLFF